MAVAGRTEPELDGADRDLLDLACTFALGAMDTGERDVVAERLRTVEPGTRRAFGAVVRDVQETMAHAAVATAVQPRAALRAQVMAEIRAAAQPG